MSNQSEGYKQLVKQIECSSQKINRLELEVKQEYVYKNILESVKDAFDSESKSNMPHPTER